MGADRLFIKPYHSLLFPFPLRCCYLRPAVAISDYNSLTDNHLILVVKDTFVRRSSLPLATNKIYPKTSTMDVDLHISTIESSSAVDIVHQVQNLGIEEEAGAEITCFSDMLNDIPIHFQIICFPKQIYAWIGCHTARFGCLYAAAPTRPNNIVSVTCLLGGTSDNTGSGIARRIVLKTGVPVTLACNIPKDSPMLEAHVEKKLIQKLISLGYTKSKPQAGT